MCKYADVRMKRCADVQMCKCANYRCVDDFDYLLDILHVPIFEIFTFAHLHI